MSVGHPHAPVSHASLQGVTPQRASRWPSHHPAAAEISSHSPSPTTARLIRPQFAFRASPVNNKQRSASAQPHNVAVSETLSSSHAVESPSSAASRCSRWIRPHKTPQPFTNANGPTLKLQASRRPDHASRGEISIAAPPPAGRCPSTIYGGYWRAPSRCPRCRHSHTICRRPGNEASPRRHG